MKRMLIGFFVQEDGAVTVDWVVLTAAIVTLGLAVVTPIATGTMSMSSILTQYIGSVELGTGNSTP